MSRQIEFDQAMRRVMDERLRNSNSVIEILLRQEQEVRDKEVIVVELQELLGFLGKTDLEDLRKEMSLIDSDQVVEGGETMDENFDDQEDENLVQKKGLIKRNNFAL